MESWLSHKRAIESGCWFVWESERARQCDRVKVAHHVKLVTSEASAWLRKTHTHIHTREKTTGRCYSVWPWAERFLSLWSRKSFKGLVHPNYKKHFSLLPLKQTRMKSIQREYSQGCFLLQLQISTKCITYKQTCRSEQTTAWEWSHLSHTLVLIQLYL